MFNLIVTVIAIALFAIVLTAGTNYVSVTKVNGYIKKHSIQSGVTNIGSAITEFYIYNERNPGSVAELHPGYLRSLQITENLTFSALRLNADGTLDICLDGTTVSDSELTGLLDIQDDAQSSTMVISDACWDLTDTIPTGSGPHALAVSIAIR